MKLEKLHTPREDVEEAARLRYLGYDFSTIAGIIGSTSQTIRNWSKQEWWIELMYEVRQEEDEIRLGLARRAQKELLQSTNEAERGRATRFELERRDPEFAQQASKPAPKEQKDPFAEITDDELRELLRIAKSEPERLEDMRAEAKENVANTITVGPETSEDSI